MSGKSVLVTGASSGIGRATVEELHKTGYIMHATVRKQEDADVLQDDLDGVVTHIVDLTDSAGIKQLADSIGELYGLVNNAGVALPSAVLKDDMSSLRMTMEVNFFAPVHLTSLLLPKLIESKGIVVNMSSVSGRFALPFFHPYASSKYALEAFSDSLRREVDHLGVRVVVIQPGRVKTPIWKKGTSVDLSRYEGTPYEKSIKHALPQAVNNKGLEPSEVAKLICRVMRKKRPKPRYLIAERTLLFKLMPLLPTWLVDRMMRKQMGLERG